MAIVLIEGFDHYDVGGGTTTVREVEQKYNHIDSQALSAMTTDTPNGKGYALDLTGSTMRFWPYFGYYYCEENIDYSIPQGVVGFHFKTDSYNSSTGIPILELGHGRLSASCQLSVKIDGSTGKLKLYRGASTQELGVSSQSISNDTWYYIELKYQISNSIDANSTILRVDAENWISLTSGADTQADASVNDVHAMKWESANGAHRYIDNVYVCDASGTYNTNTFLNKGLGCFVETLKPTANGNYSQFSPSTSTNYSCVDDVAPDDDSTYNESTTADHKDTFTFEELEGWVGTIHGVQTVAHARRDTFKMCSLKHMCRVSSTDYTRWQKLNILDEKYDYFTRIWQENPYAGGLWTQSALESAEFGYTFDLSIDSGTLVY